MCRRKTADPGNQQPIENRCAICAIRREKRRQTRPRVLSTQSGAKSPLGYPCPSPTRNISTILFQAWARPGDAALRPVKELRRITRLLAVGSALRRDRNVGRGPGGRLPVPMPVSPAVAIQCGMQEELANPAANESAAEPVPCAPVPEPALKRNRGWFRPGGDEPSIGKGGHAAQSAAVPRAGLPWTVPPKADRLKRMVWPLRDLVWRLQYTPPPDSRPPRRPLGVLDGPPIPDYEYEYKRQMGIRNLPGDCEVVASRVDVRPGCPGPHLPLAGVPRSRGCRRFRSSSHHSVAWTAGELSRRTSTARRDSRCPVRPVLCPGAEVVGFFRFFRAHHIFASYS